MGLKTKNYYIESFDEILPEAYATIYKVNQERNSITAVFGIHKTREKSLGAKPLELTKPIHIVWDRKTPIQEAIYNAAKKSTLEYLNPETNEVEVVEIKGILSDWEDDIVEE